jgi:hypothetical protein
MTVTNKLSPENRVLLEKLIVAQPFMEREGSLPCSQEPGTGAYPELSPN